MPCHDDVTQLTKCEIMRQDCRVWSEETEWPRNERISYFGFEIITQSLLKDHSWVENYIWWVVMAGYDARLWTSSLKTLCEKHLNRFRRSVNVQMNGLKFTLPWSLHHHHRHHHLTIIQTDELLIVYRVQIDNYHSIQSPYGAYGVSQEIS